MKVSLEASVLHTRSDLVHHNLHPFQQHGSISTGKWSVTKDNVLLEASICSCSKK